MGGSSSSANIVEPGHALIRISSVQFREIENTHKIVDLVWKSGGHFGRLAESVVLGFRGLQVNQSLMIAISPTDKKTIVLGLYGRSTEKDRTLIARGKLIMSQPPPGTHTIKDSELQLDGVGGWPGATVHFQVTFAEEVTSPQPSKIAEEEKPKAEAQKQPAPVVAKKEEPGKGKKPAKGKVAEQPVVAPKAPSKANKQGAPETGAPRPKVSAPKPAAAEVPKDRLVEPKQGKEVPPEVPTVQPRALERPPVADGIQIAAPPATPEHPEPIVRSLEEVRSPVKAEEPPQQERVERVAPVVAPVQPTPVVAPVQPAPVAPKPTAEPKSEPSVSSPSPDPKAKPVTVAMAKEVMVDAVGRVTSPPPAAAPPSAGQPAKKKRAPKKAK